MKYRRRSEHDPYYLIKKYDQLGNVRPEWKAAYLKKSKADRRRPQRKPKL